jgi:putative exosortase-associated protein (TIGR04073 family)
VIPQPPINFISIYFRGLPMKRIFKSLLLLSSLLLFTPQVAMAESYRIDAGEKLLSGIANVATGVVELPKTIIVTSQRENVFYGMTVGMVKGIMHMAGRTLIGALNVATFPLPTDPWVDPQYIWEDFETETSYRYRQTR